MNNTTQYTSLILSAGLSKRMGMPKMLLHFKERQTFLDAIVQGYFLFGCPQIVVVVNQQGRAEVEKLEAKKTVRIVVNPHPEWGRFYSIQLGLKAMSSCRGAFIHNIDNPFVYEEVLAGLIGGLEQNDYAVPVFHGKGGHPILLSEKVIGNLMGTHDTSVNFKNYLQPFSRVEVSVRQKDILTNINTPEQYVAHGFHQ